VTETLLDVLEVVRCAASLASARHCLVREVMPFTLSVCAYTVSRPCHSDNTATLRRSHTHNRFHHCFVVTVASIFIREWGGEHDDGRTEGPERGEGAPPQYGGLGLADLTENSRKLNVEIAHTLFLSISNVWRVTPVAKQSSVYIQMTALQLKG